ncbi:MAG: adenylate/guanylate cyclase domain-containing protein [Bdellovibrionales bacterium]
MTITSQNSKSSKQDLLRQYRNWEDYNRLTNAKAINYICLFVMTFMVFFDYMFVANPIPFVTTRVISIAALLPNHVLISSLRRIGIQNSVTRILSSFAMVWPALVYMCAYSYLNFGFEHEKFNVYYIGTHLGIFYSTLILHRFWREQYAFNTIVFVGSIYMAASNPLDSNRDYYLIIGIASIVAGCIGFYFRREFASNLFSKYNLFRAMVPDKVASFLLASDENTDYKNVFEAKDRFTVCVCADWRDFQSLCSEKTPDEIYNMLEKYYDIIIENLEKIVPNFNYYFNWTADELFVVFFSDDDHREQVINDALSFCSALINQIFCQIRSEVSSEITYDVGIAAGVGLLGLQGPQRLKKTTITGEVAGRAKRFETEAKLQRKMKNRPDAPIAVMDESLYEFLVKKGLEDLGQFSPIKAKTKDIENQNVYSWIAAESNSDLNKKTG